MGWWIDAKVATYLPDQFIADLGYDEELPSDGSTLD
jgi:hypothetical protein